MPGLAGDLGVVKQEPGHRGSLFQEFQLPEFEPDDVHPGILMRFIWVSLKLAVIQTSCSGTTVNICWPGWTFRPTTTVLLTSPLIAHN
jgi:hypothetical protein